MYHVVIFHKSFVVLPIATHRQRAHVLFVACLAMAMMIGDRGEVGYAIGKPKVSLREQRA